MESNWKVHNLRLSDSNKHKYQALTCNKCKILTLSRSDHIRADEVRNCNHKAKRISLQGKNWTFAGG